MWLMLPAPSRRVLLLLCRFRHDGGDCAQRAREAAGRLLRHLQVSQRQPHCPGCTPCLLCLIPMLNLFGTLRLMAIATPCAWEPAMCASSKHPVPLPVCSLPTYTPVASTLLHSLCVPPSSPFHLPTPFLASAPCRQDGNGVVRALVELGVIKPQGDMLSVRRAINYFIENIKRQTERQETIGVSCCGDDAAAACAKHV